MPLFTLATVTLNNAQGIEKTYKSIENQDFSDFEWLVQDGASEDNSLAILSKTSASVQSTPDNGIYDAMSRLIDRATGDYILFLNAGDTLAAPDTLKTIANTIGNDTPDFIYGDALENHNGSSRYKSARSHKNIALGMFTHHQSILYRRNKIGDLRYNEAYKIAADYDFTARFLQQKSRIEYIPQPICTFEPGGLSQQQTALGRDEQFQIRKRRELCSPVQNHAITFAQALNMQLRRLAPNTYWLLKQR